MKTAAIQKILTRDRSYGFPDSRWDSMPEWTYWDACIVKIKAHGQFPWGPFTYKRNGGKQHKGISELLIEESWIFGHDGYEKRADDYLLKIGAQLEARGYAVTITEIIDKTSQDVQTHVEWINNLPPEWVLKRMGRGYRLSPHLEDMI